MKPKLTPRKLMELAIEVMRQSVPEPRKDGKASPKVGVVLVKPDGKIETACRGELRHGDHAEFTLLVRKNRGNNWMDLPCSPPWSPALPARVAIRKWTARSEFVLPESRKFGSASRTPTPRSPGKGITHLEQKGWQWLAMQGRTSSSHYADIMKIEPRTARRHLNRFEELGLVRKTGSGPSIE